MYTLAGIVEALKNTSEGAATLRTTQLLAFMVISSKIRKNILGLYPSTQHPDDTPILLPAEAITLLSRSCDISEDLVEVCWTVMRDMVWKSDDIWDCISDDRAVECTFRKNGGLLFPSQKSLWPPTLVCVNHECPYVQNEKRLKLSGLKERHAILYTKADGPVPVMKYHITCNGCKRIYHHDYYVEPSTAEKKARRYYYSCDPIPDILQLSEHSFAETSLIRMWRSNMLHAHVSATNCAKIYQTSTPNPALIPTDWKVNPGLRPENIYDGLKLLSLLEHYQTCSGLFNVLDQIPQAHRFDEAMIRVNDEIRVHGQPEIDHRCDKCVRHWIEKGKAAKEIFAVVCDGVTVGRPTCAVPHCAGMLENTKQTYCVVHCQQMERICRIIGCSNMVESGHKTCAEPEHRHAEEKYLDAGQATFQLKKRWERAVVEGDEAQHLEEEELDTGSEAVFEAMVDSGKGKGEKKIRGQFGRKRTHNEQLIIAPCGMILARETFLHSEAFSLVAKFVVKTFNGRRCPNHFIYDTNCILSQYVHNPKTDPEIQNFFENIGLSVDVFHFKCKHKESDGYCAKHCNPYQFKEMLYVDENGKERWFFNTSIAEQTNAWFGQYHSMCREMGCIFYEFFLNEMILLHNEQMKTKLYNDGYGPTYWQ